MKRNIKNIVLIVAPLSQTRRNKTNNNIKIPPIGILHLANYLREKSYDVFVHDLMSIQTTKDKFFKTIIKQRPDVVGFTTYPDNWKSTRYLINELKKIWPGIITVAGGPLVTFSYNEFMEKVEQLDFAVLHEGEISFEHLLSTLSKNNRPELAKVEGICYRDSQSKRIIKNSARKPIKNLDDLPICDVDFIDIDNYAMPFSISTARGCPGKCVFCSANTMHSSYRSRSIESVMKQIKYFIDRYDIKNFYITDDTFTAIRSRVFSFCQELNKLDRKLGWMCETRADAVNPEIAEAMAGAGCHRVQIGLESSNNEILKKIRKNVTIEQIEYAIKCFYQADIRTYISFIFGHAWDTIEIMRKLIDYVEQLKKKYNVAPFFGVNTPYPGTYQYEHSQEIGLNIHSHRWEDLNMAEPIISTENFTTEQLRSIYFEAVERLQS
ncbi:MAG: B12-binding domain-containing radical SAM protein [Planctomycetes bacterium]|nr:B12-binding domain-containing radical SAM protein [Planctomycetota bacterium]